MANAVMTAIVLTQLKKGNIAGNMRGIKMIERYFNEILKSNQLLQDYGLLKIIAERSSSIEQSKRGVESIYTGLDSILKNVNSSVLSESFQSYLSGCYEHLKERNEQTGKIDEEIYAKILAVEEFRRYAWALRSVVFEMKSSLQTITWGCYYKEQTRLMEENSAAFKRSCRRMELCCGFFEALDNCLLEEFKSNLDHHLGLSNESPHNQLFPENGIHYKRSVPLLNSSINKTYEWFIENPLGYLKSQTKKSLILAEKIAADPYKRSLQINQEGRTDLN